MKGKQLTVRERKLIKNLLAGKSPTTALLESGYSKHTAKTQQDRTVRQSKILTGIQAAYEKAGISDSYLSKVAQEGLEATKVISANVIAPNGEGMKDANSMTKDFVEVPDYATRHKYLDTAHKLKGDYPAEKKDVNLQGEVTTNVIFEVVHNG